MNTRTPRRYRFSLHGQPWYGSGRRSRRQPAGANGPVRYTNVGQVKLAPIVGHENLLAAFYALKAEGGQAPGPDGVTYAELGRREAAEAARALSRLLTSGDYRPGPSREVRVPKASGGHRTLRIRNLIDRVVSKALAEALTPALDGFMSPHSYGFRPGRSHIGLLADLAAEVEATGRWVVAEDDVNTAFDNIAIAPAVEAFRRHIGDPGVVNMIETVLRGGDDTQREVGIAQGDPLSPLTLNIYLDHALDRPLIVAAGPGVPSWRYADNIVCAARDVPEGRHSLAAAAGLLGGAGLTLKGHQPVNLRRHGAKVHLLGFHVSSGTDGRVRFDLSRDAWSHLESSLLDAHESCDPTRTAREIICGWLQATGPALGNAWECETLDGVLGVMSRTGFRDVARGDDLTSAIRESRAVWSVIRERAVRRRRELT